MQHRHLGRTGQCVSVVGFGAATLGEEYGPLDEAVGIRAVHRALDLGITYFDTSPYYGRLLAEERLGRALEGRRDEAFLATKCGRYGVDDFDFSAARVGSSIDDSLRRLRTDRVDLYQVHDVEFGDRRRIIEETLPAMRDVQATGKARFIGITGLPVAMLHDVARAFPVDSVLSYCHYDLLAQDMDEELAPFAAAAGIGLVNASALHMGLLSGAPAQPWHPAPREVRDTALGIAALCRAHGRDVAEVALRFALDHPTVASTIVGISTPDQAEACVRVLEHPTDPALVAAIAELVGPVRNWTWHEGRPENAPACLRPAAIPRAT